MNVELIAFPTIADQRGKLCFFEEGQPFYFPIKRLYWIYDVPQLAIRGAHAHKQLRQVLVCINGSVELGLNDGSSVQKVLLKSPNAGLYIDKMIWRDITNFSSDAVLLILASEKYSEDDYYRNYEDFLSASQIS